MSFMLAPMQSCCTFLLLTLLVVTTFAGDLRCLRPGAPVISLYKDNRYFPGRLDGLGESIDVTFENGQQQSYMSYTNDVIVDDVPDISELIGGSRVLARRPSSISFEPGFVNGSIEGLPLNDTFLVNYDSGDSIARSVQDIRLAVKPRSCMNEKGIYIGCFENVVNNFLTNYYPVNPTDIATCNWACYTRGFRFAGLQNGTWCFCGNHVNDSLKVEDTDCNIACRDSREDVCGGYQRMTVYWTGAEFNDNSTSDLSEFAGNQDTTGQVTSSKDILKSDTTTTKSACADLYDSSQCNAWADQSKCIEDPDWMIANCKKSCYACGYNEDKSSSAVQDNTPVTSSPPQSNTYQSSVGYQAPSSYPQSSYPTSQDSSAGSSSKKSDDPVFDKTSNTPGYLGCFRDSPTSHDLEYLADIRPLSIRGCVTKCKSMRFPYAGVQSSSSCYCGLHYGKYGQLEHEDCNTPCEADASEMCGGLFKNSLFHTGFPVKFKSAENTSTRKNLPSLSSARNNMGTAAAYPPNPSYNYPSQYPQTAYPQRNLGYTQPVYPRPASSYTQASMPGYPPRPYAQTNGYQSPYAYNAYSNYNNNQARGSTQSGSTNAVTRDFSPADSSSYRWRESYVKLREQEQERFSKPSAVNLRKLSKLPGNSWAKISENSEKRYNPSNHKTRDSSKFPNLGKDNTKAVKETKESSSKSTNSVSQSLYKQLMSQVYKNYKGRKFGRNKKTRQKNSKLRHKEFGKPGVFLRKKASKKNSFLAFLPHEVTEDESLLENVYNMLSVMLKNLKKHKKSSMKNLRKYLKFSESNGENSKLAGKATLDGSNKKQSVDSSSTMLAKDQHQQVAKNHLPQGQKQLSKPDGISRAKIRAVPYAPRGGQDTNASLETTNGDSSHTTSNDVKSTENLNTKDVQPSSTTTEGTAAQSEQIRNVSSNTLQTKMPSQGHHLSISTNKYKTKAKEKHKSTSAAKKVDEKFEMKSRILETISKLEHEKQGKTNQENRRKKVEAEVKNTGGQEANLQFDKEKGRNNTNENNTVEKSDDEIITTIVDMLEKETAMRKMNNTRGERGKQNDKTTQRKNGRKRKNKKHNKKSKFRKQTHQRKHKFRTDRRDEMDATKRIYKKDHLERVMTDDNLMREDEDYRENNGMSEDLR